MGKKDEYRFTIRFDPDDDRHRLAAQILNSQGCKCAGELFDHGNSTAK